MAKEIIQFSHANGFPSSTYRSLFSLLAADYQIETIEMLGHKPGIPVLDNWTSLTAELIGELDRKQLKNVIGIGHSLGGAISLFAAIKRPDLFKMLILLDTPVFSYPRAKLVQLFKKIGRADLITPGGRVKRRRTTWPSFETALAYFRSRPLFKNFTPECLEDYIKYGTEETAEGLTLRFSPEIESDIYLTLPHNYSKYKHALKVPAQAIIGKNSSVISKSDKISMKKNFNIETVEVRGGHLFPFEYPQETAAAIKTAIYTLKKRLFTIK